MSKSLIKINVKKIESNIFLMLDFLDYNDFDIGVWFTTNRTIRSYNKTYRKKDKPTDILSFPYHTTLKPGEKIKIKTPEVPGPPRNLCGEKKIASK